jgi:AraC-like DNA-binding protein
MSDIPLWRMPLQSPPRVRSLAVGAVETTHPRSYQLPGLWCLHLYRWSGTVSIDGVRVPIRPGHAGICPPAQRLDYWQDEPMLHVYSHFYLADGAPGEPVSMPALVDLGPRFERMWAFMLEGGAWLPTAPARAQARLWEVLWQIQAIAAQGRSRPRDALARAREHIEANLTEPLAVSEVAEQAGCSHNHLIRLFRRELDTTIVGYIRARRAERARHLLERSDAPIRDIAAEVGVPDLARFNKLIRRELGHSPRRVREHATVAVR